RKNLFDIIAVAQIGIEFGLAETVPLDRDNPQAQFLTHGPGELCKLECLKAGALPSDKDNRAVVAVAFIDIVGGAVVLSQRVYLGADMVEIALEPERCGISRSHLAFAGNGGHRAGDTICSHRKSAQFLHGSLLLDMSTNPAAPTGGQRPDGLLAV